MTVTFLNLFQSMFYHLYCRVSNSCKEGRCNQLYDNKTFVADTERTRNHRTRNDNNLLVNFPFRKFSFSFLIFGFFPFEIFILPF